MSPVSEWNLYLCFMTSNTQGISPSSQCSYSLPLFFPHFLSYNVSVSRKPFKNMNIINNSDVCRLAGSFAFSITFLLTKVKWRIIWLSIQFGLSYAKQHNFQNTQKRCPFHYRGLECKIRKLRNTWSNRQIWPWNTE